ncbi:hypothetical protein BHE74_00051501 [Ensete ventricosum]|nr:hypothetical protein BHE74_00051501 [Ensete ventricosum]
MRVIQEELTPAELVACIQLITERGRWKTPSGEEEMAMEKEGDGRWWRDAFRLPQGIQSPVELKPKCSRFLSAIALQATAYHGRLPGDVHPPRVSDPVDQQIRNPLIVPLLIPQDELNPPTPG